MVTTITSEGITVRKLKIISSRLIYITYSLVLLLKRISIVIHDMDDCGNEYIRELDRVLNQVVIKVLANIICEYSELAIFDIRKSKLDKYWDYNEKSCYIISKNKGRDENNIENRYNIIRDDWKIHEDRDFPVRILFSLDDNTDQYICLNRFSFQNQCIKIYDGEIKAPWLYTKFSNINYKHEYGYLYDEIRQLCVKIIQILHRNKCSVIYTDVGVFIVDDEKIIPNIPVEVSRVMRRDDFTYKHTKLFKEEFHQIDKINKKIFALKFKMAFDNEDYKHLTMRLSDITDITGPIYTYYFGKCGLKEESREILRRASIMI